MTIDDAKKIIDEIITGEILIYEETLDDLYDIKKKAVSNIIIRNLLYEEIDKEIQDLKLRLETLYKISIRLIMFMSMHINVSNACEELLKLLNKCKYYKEICK